MNESLENKKLNLGDRVRLIVALAAVGWAGTATIATFTSAQEFAKDKEALKKEVADLKQELQNQQQRVIKVDRENFEATTLLEKLNQAAKDLGLDDDLEAKYKKNDLEQALQAIQKHSSADTFSVLLNPIYHLPRTWQPSDFFNELAIYDMFPTDDAALRKRLLEEAVDVFSKLKPDFKNADIKLIGVLLEEDLIEPNGSGYQKKVK